MDLEGNMFGLPKSPPSLFALTFDIWGLHKLLKTYKKGQLETTTDILKTVLKIQNDFLHIN